MFIIFLIISLVSKIFKVKKEIDLLSDLNFLLYRYKV